MKCNIFGSFSTKPVLKRFELFVAKTGTYAPHILNAFIKYLYFYINLFSKVFLNKAR